MKFCLFIVAPLVFMSCKQRNFNAAETDFRISWPEQIDSDTADLSAADYEVLGQQIDSQLSTTRVVFLGDSGLLGHSGEALFKHTASKVGIDNTSLFAVCGSSAFHWLSKDSSDTTLKIVPCGSKAGSWSTIDGLKHAQLLNNQIITKPNSDLALPKLNVVINNYNPKLFVFSFGVNDTPADYQTKKNQFSSVMRLVKEANAQCIWIAPQGLNKAPYFTKEKINETYKSLHDANAEFKNCHIIDNRDLIPNAGDGIHMAGSVANKWVERVKSAIYQKLN